MKNNWIKMCAAAAAFGISAGAALAGTPTRADIDPGYGAAEDQMTQEEADRLAEEEAERQELQDAIDAIREAQENDTRDSEEYQDAVDLLEERDLLTQDQIEEMRYEETYDTDFIRGGGIGAGGNIEADVGAATNIDSENTVNITGNVEVLVPRGEEYEYDEENEWLTGECEDGVTCRIEPDTCSWNNSLNIFVGAGCQYGSVTGGPIFEGQGSNPILPRHDVEPIEFTVYPPEDYDPEEGCAFEDMLPNSLACTPDYVASTLEAIGFDLEETELPNPEEEDDDYDDYDPLWTPPLGTHFY